MLHGWNWFVDPNEVGNRIWLAWDVSEVVVDIISVHEQYIHCRIICLRAHYDFLVTVAYGLNDVVPRRALWSQLVTIMEDVGEEPWLVLGDFNTVLDHSEVVVTQARHPCQPHVSPTVGAVIIPNDEWETMIWPVEREEIKAAFFDIDEDKAPGPDGFSAGFFKAACSVIGDELTTAIQDFFVSGKMLKQVNATVLSLIPKVANPTTVAEFRPISCCNVLYKAITKIIVQRMHAVMGKIVSSSQNAFVPGRRISNNTLIGQELFHGYNRQNLPPRCALKVDLWKAYDTLEWDFIHAMLFVFGFPEKMIMWIVKCISTTTYSVALNGELQGFFPGARGIRQGDPMLPYLFVLAMEILHLILLQRIEQAESFQYHWQCNEMKLFNLCFADDLLLFCKAEENSVKLFRDALHAFVELSGLHANISKKSTDSV
ncbi:UNVERIFIED_CONTAM: hypothetical protein Slati_0881600 [Sesamum latifolium]|uniref:Reverse transcriptase domain-containing protein n=1 Tax=Sesamum latifolium TaxID=2727402 RepID=A0AAW2XNF4_9LAMI